MDQDPASPSPPDTPHVCEHRGPQALWRPVFIQPRWGWQGVCPGSTSTPTLDLCFGLHPH